MDRPSGMSTALRLTLGEYDQMIADGAFETLRDRRIELIHGELREMTPPGPDHACAVDWIQQWSVYSPPRAQVRVRVQNPIGIPPSDSEPEPDICWVKPGKYRQRHPRPEEVLLVVEVADSSLDYDMGEKADLYAAAGIADYWVVNLPGRCVDVFRSPASGKYAEHTTHPMGQEIRPLAFPEVILSTTELFTTGPMEE
ncbi:MAG TPA: Uma2 family endonuclease [Pirellulaceae bacterium]|nr:Uma2 family endonuclease [Pirellulaceae bacterium]